MLNRTSRVSFQLNQTLRGKAKKDEDNGDGNGRPDDLEAVIPMDLRRFSGGVKHPDPMARLGQGPNPWRAYPSYKALSKAMATKSKAR